MTTVVTTNPETKVQSGTVTVVSSKGEVLQTTTYSGGKPTGSSGKSSREIRQSQVGEQARHEEDIIRKAGFKPEEEARRLQQVKYQETVLSNPYTSGTFEYDFYNKTGKKPSESNVGAEAYGKVQEGKYSTFQSFANDNPALFIDPTIRQQFYNEFSKIWETKVIPSLQRMESRATTPTDIKEIVRNILSGKQDLTDQDKADIMKELSVTEKGLVREGYATLSKERPTEFLGKGVLKSGQIVEKPYQEYFTLSLTPSGQSFYAERERQAKVEIGKALPFEEQAGLFIQAPTQTLAKIGAGYLATGKLSISPFYEEATEKRIAREEAYTKGATLNLRDIPAINILPLDVPLFSAKGWMGATIETSKKALSTTLLGTAVETGLSIEAFKGLEIAVKGVSSLLPLVKSSRGVMNLPKIVNTAWDVTGLGLFGMYLGSEAKAGYDIYKAPTTEEKLYRGLELGTRLSLTVPFIFKGVKDVATRFREGEVKKFEIKEAGIPKVREAGAIKERVFGGETIRWLPETTIFGSRIKEIAKLPTGKAKEGATITSIDYERTGTTPSGEVVTVRGQATPTTLFGSVSQGRGALNERALNLFYSSMFAKPEFLKFDTQNLFKKMPVGFETIESKMQHPEMIAGARKIKPQFLTFEYGKGKVTVSTPYKNLKPKIRMAFPFEFERMMKQTVGFKTPRPRGKTFEYTSTGITLAGKGYVPKIFKGIEGMSFIKSKGMFYLDIKGRRTGEPLKVVSSAVAQTKRFGETKTFELPTRTEYDTSSITRKGVSKLLSWKRMRSQFSEGNFAGLTMKTRIVEKPKIVETKRIVEMPKPITMETLRDIAKVYEKPNIEIANKPRPNISPEQAKSLFKTLKGIYEKPKEETVEKFMKIQAKEQPKPKFAIKTKVKTEQAMEEKTIDYDARLYDAYGTVLEPQVITHAFEKTMPEFNTLVKKGFAFQREFKFTQQPKERFLLGQNMRIKTIEGQKGKLMTFEGMKQLEGLKQESSQELKQRLAPFSTTRTKQGEAQKQRTDLIITPFNPITTPTIVPIMPRIIERKPEPKRVDLYGLTFPQMKLGKRKKMNLFQKPQKKKKPSLMIVPMPDPLSLLRTEATTFRPARRLPATKKEQQKFAKLIAKNQWSYRYPTYEMAKGLVGKKKRGMFK